MTQKMLWAVLLSTAVWLGTTVQAADIHGHDHRPMHGGIVAEAADDVKVELVATSDGLTFHVTQHGKPLTTTGAKGTATVHAGGDKNTVALEPVGDNRLVGKGSFKVGVGVRVAAAVALAGKPEAKLNFRLK